MNKFIFKKRKILSVSVVLMIIFSLFTAFFAFTFTAEEVKAQTAAEQVLLDDLRNDLGNAAYDVLINEINYRGALDLIHDVGSGNIGTLITHAGGPASLGSLINGVGSGNMNRFLSQIGGVDNIDAFLNGIGGIAGLDPFLDRIGIDHISTIISAGGGISSFADYILAGGGINAVADALGIPVPDELVDGLAALLDKGPCSESILDKLISKVKDIIISLLPAAPGLPGLGGTFVPVKDQAVIDALDKTNAYLKLLCTKEYEEDKTLQHAWRKVIDEFVRQTWEFVLFGYNGNPIFLQNQTIYAQLVDDEVLLTFLQEIMISRIGENTKRKIVGALLLDRFENIFPFNVNGSVDPDIVMASDEVYQIFRDNFIKEGGLATLRKLTPSINSESGTVDIARAEFDRRRDERRNYETQKLDWGRGFYSYEYCNDGDGNADGRGSLGLFSDIRQDRRNCYIVTPGSLIQDQTSFVFGSALRQMELNDEYEEWIGQTSFEVLVSTVSQLGLDYGIDNDNSVYNSYVGALPRVVGPDVIESELINKLDFSNLGDNYIGPNRNEIKELVPTEFSEDYIDPETSTLTGRNNLLLQRIGDTGIYNIPLLNP